MPRRRVRGASQLTGHAAIYTIPPGLQRWRTFPNGVLAISGPTVRMSRSSFSAAIGAILDFWPKRVAKWRQSGLRFLVLLASFAMTSCAVSPVGDGAGAAIAPEAKRELVTKRVNARWDAMIRGDLDAVYALLSPTSKATTTLEQFKRVTRKEGFREAKIEQIDCDVEVCKVMLKVTYDHPLVKGIPAPMVETWVFDKGEAWYVFRE
jgi:hypothetical protein